MSGDRLSSGTGDGAGTEQGMIEASVAPMEAIALSVGQRLREAREAKGLTTGDVAKALKLSRRQIDALEADDWSSLPCTAIIRGFVRNYARLLDLSSDALMTTLDGLEMPQASQLELDVGASVRLPQESKVDWRDYIRILAGLLILILAISAYFLLPQNVWRSSLSLLNSATQQSHDSVDEKSARSTMGDGKTSEVIITPPATDVLAKELAPSPEALQPSVSAPVSQAVSGSGLKFRFAQPSWVEVRDRSGQIIFAQLNPAGSQQEVEGLPPFALVVGNAAHVSLQYKGKVVDLSKRSKDDVARLTLE